MNVNNKNNSNLGKNVFPVNLIVEGRKFLVVGGGQVALRKVKLLLEAWAHVTVVSSSFCPELKQLKETGTIHVIEREFSPNDVEGMLLAFAATNKTKVNHAVIESCKRKGVLVCSVDEQWPHGDFITPAILRQKGIVLTVSTAGSSCKRAGMIKENISRHMELLEGNI